MANKVTNIEVKDTTIRTIKHEGEDFVCITDIARQKNSVDPNGVIANWMRNRNTIEFLGIWEQLFNPSFNPLEFEGFRKEAGLNAVFINDGIPQSERLIKLNKIAIQQMQVLEDVSDRKLLQ